MKYIVSVSGGLGSAEALRRCVEKYGRENIVAVYADVKGDPLVSHRSWSQFPYVDALLHERYGGERPDTQRFLWRLSYALNIPIERLEDKQKRTIYAVQVESKSISLFTPYGVFCKASEVLKREVIAQYLVDSSYEPDTYTMVLGMGWTEPNRVKQAKQYWSKRMGWDVPVIAPNAEKPFPENINIRDNLAKLGVDEIPSAYEDGLEHNNCPGCVLAGQGHFAIVYQKTPEAYLYYAWMEKRVDETIGKDYTILKDQRGGTTTPLTLYEFLPRIEAGDYRKNQVGGCGCFTNLPMDFVQMCDIKPPEDKPASVKTIQIETTAVQLELI